MAVSSLPLRVSVWLGLLGLLPAWFAHGEPWQQGAGHRFRLLSAPAEGRAGFTVLAPAQTGVTFTNALPELRLPTNQIMPPHLEAKIGYYPGESWLVIAWETCQKPNEAPIMARSFVVGSV